MADNKTFFIQRRPITKDFCVTSVYQRSRLAAVQSPLSLWRSVGAAPAPARSALPARSGSHSPAGGATEKYQTNIQHTDVRHCNSILHITDCMQTDTFIKIICMTPAKNKIKKKPEHHLCQEKIDNLFLILRHLLF